MEAAPASSDAAARRLKKKQKKREKRKAAKQRQDAAAATSAASAASAAAAAADTTILESRLAESRAVSVLTDTAIGSPSADDLARWPVDRLGRALQVRGVKCGGSAHDRAARLASLLGRRTLPGKQGKLISTTAKAALAAVAAASSSRQPPALELHNGLAVIVDAAQPDMAFAAWVRPAPPSNLPPVAARRPSATAPFVFTPEALAQLPGAPKPAAADKSEPARRSPSPPPPAAITHAFRTDDDDHCETPLEAYRDIGPLLALLAKRLGKTRATLAIYDPYYCAGGVERNLNTLGFTNVYNRNEDFYACLAAGRLPEHDVVVTNPPYSQDHLERITAFCRDNGRPWLLLVPNFVYAKPYYKALASTAQPIYLAPRKRYCYWTPKQLKRGKHTHTGTLGERTSPFITFWFCGLGPHRQAALAHLRSASPSAALAVAASIEELPAGVLVHGDPVKKRKEKTLKSLKRRSLPQASSATSSAPKPKRPRR